MEIRDSHNIMYIALILFTDKAHAHELVPSKESNKYKRIHNFVHNLTIIIVK